MTIEIVIMIEQWERWEPIAKLSAKYYVESICYHLENLTIVLFDEADTKVQVTFKKHIDSYRSVDESFRLSTMHDLSNRYGANFYGDWTFFKVTNSLYVTLLSKQPCIDATLPLQHFSLITFNSIIDILSVDGPTLEFIL